MNKKLIIGIIGGTGILGTIFKNFFENQGYKVLVSGRKTELTAVKLTNKSNVVIFCVPIDVSVKVIQSILPYTRKNQLLMDFTSIKKFTIDEMLRSKASVIGLHPMFGKVKSIEGETVIIIPARPGKWQIWIEELLKKEKLNIKVTTVDKHDKIMSVLQGLIHFNYISLSHTFSEESKKLGIDINDLLDYGGIIYELRLGTTSRILSQDPKFYADLAKERIKNNLKQAEKLNKIINTNNKEEFVKYFKEASEFYKGFEKEALKNSEFLIEQLSKLKTKEK